MLCGLVFVATYWPCGGIDMFVQRVPEPNALLCSLLFRHRVTSPEVLLISHLHPFLNLSLFSLDEIAQKLPAYWCLPALTQI